MKKKLENKAMIIDACGIDPINFSLAEGHFNIIEVKNFLQDCKIDIYSSADALYAGEFNYAQNNQPSLFIESISSESRTLSKEKDDELIYLSYNGDFSQTASPFNENIPVPCPEIYKENQSSLWQASKHWESLSKEDKSFIGLVEDLKQTYDEVAILSNEWHLRQQCTLYDGIRFYGTCSMLAGMTLTNVFTYQKATYIYNEWLDKNPKWIPTTRNIKKKLKFKDVLDIEKKRIKRRKSFWTDY